VHSTENNDTTAHGTPMIAVGTIFTADEAAVILRVRRSWLERQAGSRRIPFTLLGGSYRFTAVHIREIIRIFEQAPAPTVGPAEVTAIAPRRHSRQTSASGREPLQARPRKNPSRQNAA
jgi:hypothetical protein